MSKREDAQKFAAEAKAKLEEARALRAASLEGKGEGAEPPADVEAKADAILTEAFDLKAKADAALEAHEKGERELELERWAEKSAGRLPGMGRGSAGLDAPQGVPTDASGRPVQGVTVQTKSLAGEVRNRVVFGRPEKNWSAAEEAKATAAFRSYLMKGDRGLTPDEYSILEAKALSVGIDTAGGFLVPEAFNAELIEDLRDAVFMRQIATVLPPLRQASSITTPAADDDLDDAEWTVELATGSADTAQPFGERKLTPHPLAKQVYVSNTLLRMSAIDAEAWVRQGIVDKFASAEETAYITGHGAGRPLGFLNSSRTGETVAASATDLAPDDLLNAVFALKSQFRSAARWMMHRTTVLHLSKKKDGEGQYIWRQGLEAGAPSQLVGYPVMEAESFPSTMTAGLNIAAFGDFKAYWIADTLNTEVQRLVELAALTNQTIFVARKETDGMLVRANRIQRIEMAP